MTNAELVAKVDSALKEFIKLTGEYPDAAEIGKRTMIQESRHIAFWHKYYADNLAAVAHQQPQPIFKERYVDLEKRCLLEMDGIKSAELVKLMMSAQRRIKQTISKGVVGKLKYKYGSRYYTISEYLGTIADHLESHNSFLRKELGNHKT